MLRIIIFNVSSSIMVLTKKKTNPETTTINATRERGVAFTTGSTSSTPELSITASTPTVQEYYYIINDRSPNFFASPNNPRIRD
jgi:hypothetical protein